MLSDREALNRNYYDALAYAGANEIRSFLDEGADVNYRGPGFLPSEYVNRPPAYIPVRRGNCEIAKLLVEHGVDLAVRDEHLESVLVYALHEGAYDIAVAYVEGGADLTVRDYRNRTPLEIVLKDGRRAGSVVKAIRARMRRQTPDPAGTI
jgi:hypothetical protein